MTKAKAEYKVGETIEFVGYTEKIPDDEAGLEKGEQYEMSSVNLENEQVGILLDFEQPDGTLARKECFAFFEEIKVHKAKKEKSVKAANEPIAEPIPETIPESVAAPAKRTKTKTEPILETQAEVTLSPPETNGHESIAPAKRGRGRPPIIKDEIVLPTIIETHHTVEGDVQAAPYAVFSEDTEVLAKEDEEILALVHNADDLLALAEEFDTNVIGAEYKLAGILYHVKLQGEYKRLDKRYEDKGGWALYLEEKLKVGYRKATYLVKAYIAGNKYLANPNEAMTNLGWTKMSRLASAMNEENAAQLVAKAENMTVKELIQELEKDIAPEDRVTLETFSFKLYKDSAEVVKTALESAAIALGLSNLSQVFEHIITQWAIEHPVGGRDIHERPGILVPKRLTN